MKNVSIRKLSRGGHRSSKIRGLLIIILSLIVLSLIFTKSTLSHAQIRYTKFYVANGDTLWSIAEELKDTNDYYKNKDIREIIEDIKDINNLDTSNLYVNQILQIPVI